MARKHPTEVITAIKALAIGGMNAGQIRRQLAAGEVPGIDPCEVPLRTIQDHAQRAHQELPEIPDDELLAVNVIERVALQIATRDMRRFEDMSAKKPLSKPEYDAAQAAIKMAQSISDRRARRTASDPERQQSGAKGARAKAGAPTTLLDAIGQEIAKREREADRRLLTEAPASPDLRTKQGEARPTVSGGNAGANGEEPASTDVLPRTAKARTTASDGIGSVGSEGHPLSREPKPEA